MRRKGRHLDIYSVKEDNNIVTYVAGDSEKNSNNRTCKASEMEMLRH
jgi:hypothetical protein